MSTTSASANALTHVNQRSQESKKVALIIGCGKAKVWRTKPWLGPVKAKDAYVGALFRACRRYAESFYPRAWFILSAKYGLLNPDARISNYDATFSEREASGAILDDQLKVQCESVLMEYDVIVSLAGHPYNRHLASALLNKQTLELPLDTFGLFDRMKWLKKAVSNRQV